MKHVMGILVGLASAATSHAGTALRVPEDYPTILAAVDAAAVGDSVLIGPGTWTDRETRPIGSGYGRANAFLKSWLTVIGTAGADATILEGDAEVPGQLNTILTWANSPTAGPLILAGLTLRGQGPLGYGFYSTGGRSVELRDCVIEGNGTAVNLASSATLQLIMRNCVVRDQDGSVHGHSGVRSSDVSWLLEGCRFENNVGGGAVLEAGQSYTSEVTILDCRFIGNRDGRLIELHDQHRVVIHDNWFEGNSSGLSSSCISVSGLTGSIEGNTFLNNEKTSLAGGFVRVGDAVDLVFNTLVGNVTPQGSSCAGIILASDEPCDFTGNIVAGCRGGPAVWRVDGYNPTNGFNVFWDNDSGNFDDYVPQPTDMSVDPEFCDLAAGDYFSVAASSPCLPENHFPEYPFPIGAGTVAGCPSTGNVIVILRADSSGMHVSGDGQDQLAPFLRVWPLGTAHTIACDSVRVMSPGFRRVFSSWSDGGARAHDITTTLPLEELTASFGGEYYLTTAVSGAGSATGAGWMTAGTQQSVTATADFGYEFVRWVGAGPGQYTGPDNPATVTMNGPITETAEFTNGEFELVVLAEEGGAVTPASGSRTSFSTVEIGAIADPYHVFREWKGQGEGSYTGANATATVTLNGPVTQVAHFEPTGFELTLSLSSTDPHLHTGAPLSFEPVYLWLDCSTAGGIQSLTAEVSGSLDVGWFLPSPGVVNAGTSGELELYLSDCTSGPARLGEFVVLPPGEGTLCLTTLQPTPGFHVGDCPASLNLFRWPEDLKITGVSTSGGVPCSFGRGCNEDLPSGTTPVEATEPALAIAYANELLGGFPNPFTAETSIRFTLSRGGPATLSVFDVAGRRVRRLVTNELPAGRQEVRWSGRDGDGRPVPAGIYFVRLEADGYTSTRKVARLRAE